VNNVAEALKMSAEGLELVFGDDLFELDLVNNDPWSLASKVGVTVLSNKNLLASYVDLDISRVVAAVFTSFDAGVFGFDVAVDPVYQGRGLGTELINIAMGEFREMPDATLELDVINKDLIPFLERTYGLEVTQQDGGHFIMREKGKEKTAAEGDPWEQEVQLAQSTNQEATINVYNTLAKDLLYAQEVFTWMYSVVAKAYLYSDLSIEEADEQMYWQLVVKLKEDMARRVRNEWKMPNLIPHIYSADWDEVALLYVNEREMIKDNIKELPKAIPSQNVDERLPMLPPEDVELLKEEKPYNFGKDFIYDPVKTPWSPLVTTFARKTK
jgi:GNAT superfamily N-acetyltransferase